VNDRLTSAEMRLDVLKRRTIISWTKKQLPYLS